MNQNVQMENLNSIQRHGIRIRIYLPVQYGNQCIYHTYPVITESRQGHEVVMTLHLWQTPTTRLMS